MKTKQNLIALSIFLIPFVIMIVFMVSLNNFIAPFFIYFTYLLVAIALTDIFENIEKSKNK